MEPYMPNNNEETPEESEIAFLRVANQLGLQRVQKTKNIQDGLALPGRPYHTINDLIDINASYNEFDKLRLRFGEIIRGLTYSEAMAWCRAFNYTYSTYLMRRYGHRQPSLEEVLITINWFNNGKPVEVNKRRYTASMF